MLRDSFQEDETLAKKFNTTAYYFVIIACTRHLEVFFFFHFEFSFKYPSKTSALNFS